MTVTLDKLNKLPDPEAADLFRSCCASSSWVSQMVEERPYDSVEHLLATADSIWEALSPEDWDEAFAQHPRIGDSQSAADRSELAKTWSDDEQSHARLASSSVHDQMALVNSAYEKKFGRIYIVSATDRSGDELLDLARERLRNDAETELRIAGEEQAKITRSRLKKLLGDTK
jgi:OHCU decarboxylase